MQARAYRHGIPISDLIGMPAGRGKRAGPFGQYGPSDEPVPVLTRPRGVFVAEVDPDRPGRLQHPHHLPGGGEQRVDELGGRGFGADLAVVMHAVVGVRPKAEERWAGHDQIHAGVGERQGERVARG